MFHSSFWITMQKFSPNRQVVLEIFKFQKSSDFIGREPFWLYITREPRFCQTCGFHQKIEHINTFRLNIIWTTSSWLVFLQKCKMSKTSFFGYFGPFLPKYGKMGVLLKNRASSLFFIYWPPTLCKKSEKTNGGKYENFCHRLTDWQTDRLTELDS